MKFKNYSVLMSVYKKETATNLRESIESMLDQTVPTNNFVLICDGELTRELNEVIRYYEQHFKCIFSVKRLKTNHGLARALDYGLRFCVNELVARMDSDDVSVKNRCEMQLNIFNTNSDVGIVGGAIVEFENNISNVFCKRILPKDNKQILAFAKFRSPFNHPSVMFKKSSVILAGGYREFYFLEDYYLWIRMFNVGIAGYNTQEVLVYMRSGDDMYRRRAGVKYAINQVRLASYMRSINYITNFEFICNCVSKVLLAIMPNCIRKVIYLNFLRKELR